MHVGHGVIDHLTSSDPLAGSLDVHRKEPHTLSAITKDTGYTNAEELSRSGLAGFNAVQRRTKLPGSV